MARTKRSKAKREELAGQADPQAALDSAALLGAARPVLEQLERDLLERAKASPAVSRAFAARYEAEKVAERTADSLAGWTAALATQVAAAWLLSCVFVRTLEDRGLLKQARLAGPGAEDSQRQFFQLAPSLTERDYLLTVFRELAHHPAAKDLFDAEHCLVWKLSPSAEVAKELLALFRTPNASAPAFRFGQPSTRFLGDLYQDLSEEARKRFALLQTPDFVESYILDRTLGPAIARFGLDDTTLIDPTCGSGHFLLGAFDRLFEHRLRAEPGIDPRVAAVKALDAVYGADINPYAVAIARFRLTLSFLTKAGYAKLAEAPALPLHLVVADSLLHNPHRPQGELEHLAGDARQVWRQDDLFALEDEAAARDVLYRRYAAVVGNPPYITVKDAALREVYRRMYVSCHRSYALSAPFCERFFQLARPRGYVGQITANSFMKREFGKPLIEEFLPSINLERIVNTSGAYIPGHGTPTVLLFGTHEASHGADVRAVLAKRGEPSTPDDPSQGLVWRSVVEHGDEVGFDNDYISVARVGRDSLAKHPWSLGGGGASELKELLEERAASRLSDHIDELGRSTHTGEDGVYFMDAATAKRLGFCNASYVPLVKGEQIRDWSIQLGEVSLFPYDHETAEAVPPLDGPEGRYYWRYRTVLRDRQDFGEKIEHRGLRWFEHSMFFPRRYLKPLGIAFAFVATHNHFVLDRGGKVFNRSAPIIKLPEGATEDDHFALLAYLNSSTACFWMKQVFHAKGNVGFGGSRKPSQKEGAIAESWEQFFEFDGTKLARLPLVSTPALAKLGRRIDELARKRQGFYPARVFSSESFESKEELESLLEAEHDAAQTVFMEMVATQEDIDWSVYAEAELFDDSDFPRATPMHPGQRAFEFRLRTESPETQWFARNAYVSPLDAEIPREVAARLHVIDTVAEIALIEHPEYKRRWSHRDQHVEVRSAANAWVAERLESGFTTEIISRRELIQRTLKISKLSVIASLLEEDPSAGLELVLASDAAPYLAACGFSEEGLRRREEWQRLWEAQRGEDRRDGTATIAVPPRYSGSDFIDHRTWNLRGKLDVPKERFISYPYCESDNDGEPVYGWAGWDHLQRAQALAALYLKRKDGEGWTADRLTPMLAGLLELIPWVKQWHNEPSTEFGGLRMGEYFEQFLDGECRHHSLTHDDLRAWRPPKKTRAKAKQKTAKPTNGADGETPATPAARKPRAKKKPVVDEPALEPEGE